MASGGLPLIIYQSCTNRKMRQKGQMWKKYKIDPANPELFSLAHNSFLHYNGISKQGKL